MIMQCLFKEKQQCYISSKKSPNQNTVVFKYYRTIEFVHISCQHKFSETWNLFVFTCNAKSLALAIFFFFLLIAVFERTGISFLPIKFLFVAHSACDQDQTYLYDMSCAFIPCNFKDKL